MKLEQTKVLVIEDDELMRTYTVNTLRRLGISQIQVCADGQSGLSALRTFDPDVILTDIHMSPMDGLEFVSRVRNDPSIGALKRKIFFLSADISSTTRAAVMPLSVDAYIVKPPRLDDLRKRFEEAIL